MSYIPEDVIQKIQDLADIRQIVSEYVPIRKRGNNWVGLCPFHNDKDPSFTVNEDKQIFHCFGCGVGGGVFKFLMLIEGMSFVEAVKALASRYGVSIPQRNRTERSPKALAGRAELLRCVEVAQAFFAEALSKDRSGLAARDYLKRRGIKEETIAHFGMGWAPSGWANLVGIYREQSIPLEVAREAGLVIEREAGKGYYDRFRERVMFPVHDRRGNIVAFGGRVIGDGEPKYINSPETVIYKKKECLYGYYLNRSFIRAQGFGLVVEGYMDLIALFQYGIKNVCATLGTALTPQHARLMKGLTKDWLLVFDGDEAGFNAARRALPILYSMGIRPKVLTLPDGHDPDSFVRSNGSHEWENLLNNAENGIDFIIRRALDHHGKGVEGRMEAAEEVVTMLNHVDDPIRKSLLISHAGQRLGIRESILLERVKVPGSKGAGNVRTRGRSNGAGAKINSSHAQLLSFILNNPHRLELFLDVGLEIWLRHEGLRDLWLSMVHAYEILGTLEIQRYLDYIAPSQGLLSLARLLLDQPPPLEDSEETVKRLLLYCESMKKRELRRDLISRLEHGTEDEEIILRKIGELH